MKKNNKLLKCLAILFLPITLYIVQKYHFLVAISLLLVFLLFSLTYKKIRKISILMCILILGYLFWNMIYLYTQSLHTNSNVLNEILIILSRFGLIGYIVLFIVWYYIDKTKDNYLKIGKMSENIKIPFIWKGFNDKVIRVGITFSITCFFIASLFTIINKLTFSTIFLGIIFSIINAVLEEVLWRSFVLNRLIDIYGEKIGLITMSLLFGIYHYALGFSIPICLLFSIGGIYFGGITIKSKGLLLATIMHFCMNILFVSIGIIF